MSSFLTRSNLSFPILSLLVAILAWLFWVIAARTATSEDIGLAASILSISSVFSALAMIGIEYPLLKNSVRSKSYFGSAMIFEIIIHLSIIPLLILALGDFSDWLIFLAIIIMIQGLFSTIPRFCLLGTLATKQVIILDLVGAIVRIILLIMFLTLNFGANGILLACSRSDNIELYSLAIGVWFVRSGASCNPAMGASIEVEADGLMAISSSSL